MNIEKNIPIPAKGGGTVWEKMEVGDSVYKEKSMFHTSYAWAKKHAPERRFIQRKEGIGYRLWRVK